MAASSPPVALDPLRQEPRNPRSHLTHYTLRRIASLRNQAKVAKERRLDDGIGEPVSAAVTITVFAADQADELTRHCRTRGSAVPFKNATALRG